MMSDLQSEYARPAPAVSGIRHIPRSCTCTWRLNLGAIWASWTLTGTDPGCKLHGSSDEKRAGE